jgi:hypothetical protein
MLILLGMGMTGQLGETALMNLYLCMLNRRGVLVDPSATVPAD